MAHSIRWRLTLAFAAIALLATFTLGAALLAIVQNYYAQRESEYLRGNASAISLTLTKIGARDLPAAVIQAQIENLAFLSQTRVRVLDTNRQMLYDSGLPKPVKVSVGSFTYDAARAAAGDEPSQATVVRFIAVGDELIKVVPNQTTPAPDAAALSALKALPVTGSPFGFAFDAKLTRDNVRSNQVARAPILDPAGQPQGSVELSDGPALGQDIVTSVAAGWALSSAVAVLLAAGVGWLLSRRISAPVLALTYVTARMAAGDLSTRAPVAGRDEIGALARSFNHMADQVEATVLALRRFVSDAAHELHTPLTALRANLDLASDEDRASQQRVFIARAQIMVGRLETLTNNLLDLSRIEALANPTTLTAINLTALIGEQSEVYASQVEQAGLNFELILPETPLLIQADATQTLRALGNLVDNACKFTPSGGTVRICLAQTDGWAQLSVADSGIGIPADEFPQLFNRFHRGRNALAYSGSGLGLAIVKAIIEQQGGQVSAENHAAGARFTLRWRVHCAPHLG